MSWLAFIEDERGHIISLHASAELAEQAICNMLSPVFGSVPWKLSEDGTRRIFLSRGIRYDVIKLSNNDYRQTVVIDRPDDAQQPWTIRRPWANDDDDDAPPPRQPKPPVSPVSFAARMLRWWLETARFTTTRWLSSRVR